MPYVSLVVTALMLVACIVLYRRNKMRLAPGLFFDGFIGCLILSYYFIGLSLFNDNAFVVFSMIAIALLVLFLLAFGLHILVLFFLINARVVYRRESRTLANSLTLITAAALIAFLLVSGVLANTSPPIWLEVIWAGFLCAFSFYILHALVYLTSLFLCNRARPKPVQDYLIVLGSGLINGKVTPLLAQRVKRAMDFGDKQVKKAGRRPMLLLSGGQGDDEPHSEAAAMAEYAAQSGWPQDHILLEERSRNTLENMLFSKQIMDERAANRDAADAGAATNAASTSAANINTDVDYSCVFATSAYHLLRAGMFARQAGLRADGLGAKSAWYFTPNAVLREYIAYLAMYKRRVIITFVLVFLLGVLARIGLFILQTYFSGPATALAVM
jgi:uncharacterized SAM-binding protein YcdF (DUF218 family)